MIKIHTALEPAVPHRIPLAMAELIPNTPSHTTSERSSGNKMLESQTRQWPGLAKEEAIFLPRAAVMEA